MGILDRRNLGGAKIIRVPEDVEFSIGRRGITWGVIVYGKRQNEVKFSIWVNGYIGKFDILEQSSYILSEEVWVGGGCLDLYLGDKESFNNEKGNE